MFLVNLFTTMLQFHLQWFACRQTICRGQLNSEVFHQLPEVSAPSSVVVLHLYSVYAHR